MITLGIESTAHTFGIAILKNKKFLCNIKDTYTTQSGGIIPTQAAVHHEKIAEELFKKALDIAGISEGDIDLISYSNAPGLAPCLHVGKNFAIKLKERLDVSVVGVNHCIAHLEIGKLVTKAKDPVLLYVSGANTQVIAFEAKKYRVFGETLDMGTGNFIDTFAREIGLGFPGGPKIAELAKAGKNFVDLPYTVKGMDFSLSGILTNLQQKYRSGKYSIEDLSFSLQETVFAMLIETAERAMAHCGKKELLLGGGVACNTRLQEMAKLMCSERGAKCFIPPNEFLVDNAGMIAWLGYKKFIVDGPDKKLEIFPYQRTDEVEVDW
jgi:N6-L-threonylcarbamoyladenine synthase